MKLFICTGTLKIPSILIVLFTLLVGCAGNAAFKSLYSVGHAVDGSVKGYLDLVVAHKVPTNDVPKVMKYYGKFQTVYLKAVDYAKYNLKSSPGTNVLEAASDVLSAVAQAKGAK